MLRLPNGRAASVDVHLTVAEYMIHVYQFLYHIALEVDEAGREIGHFVQRCTNAFAVKPI